METPDRQLRYFLQIAEHSSLSKAAEALGLSQSGLSRQLAALETQLGQVLFLRTGRGVELTEAGKRLHARIYDQYAAIDVAFRAARVADSMVEGSLKVATIHTLSHYFASNLLAMFVSQYRHVNLSVLARSSPDVVDLVERGRADIGFVYDSAVASLALDSVPLFDDQMCFIIKEDSELAHAEVDLCEYTGPLVAFPEHFALRRMLKSAGLDHRVVAEGNTIDAMLRLVSLGIGGCILPQHTPVRLMADYGLVKVPLINPLCGAGSSPSCAIHRQFRPWRDSCLKWRQAWTARTHNSYEPQFMARGRSCF